MCNSAACLLRATELNRMLADHRQELMRYDRFLLCAGDGAAGAQWRAVRIELLGTEPVGTDPRTKQAVYISDHFGLVAELRAAKSAAEAHAAK